MPLQRALRRVLHRRVDLVLGRRLLQVHVERHQRHVRRRDADRGAVQLALQLRHHQADRARRAGRGRDRRHRRGAGAMQVLVQRVDGVLVAGVGVDGHHVAAHDAEAVVQHLGHRRQAVGGARRVGDHRHVLGQRSCGSRHRRWSRRRRRRARRSAPCARRPSSSADAFSFVVKMPVHSSATSTPWYGTLVGSRLGRHLDRAPDAAVIADGDGVARHLDLAGEAAMHAVVAEQMRVGLDAAEIVDRDRHDVVAPALDIARSTRRPMRPNPLIATFTAMVALPSRHAFSPYSPSRLRTAADDGLGGDAEVFVKIFDRCRGAEAGHADEHAVSAQPALPAEPAGGLDADARRAAQHAARDTLRPAARTAPSRAATPPRR